MSLTAAIICKIGGIGKRMPYPQIAAMKNTGEKIANKIVVKTTEIT